MRSAAPNHRCDAEQAPVGECHHGYIGQVCADCKVRHFSICAALDPDELATLEALSQPTSMPARATLFSEDDSADAVFNITEGMVRLYKLIPDGRRQIVGFALPGTFSALPSSTVTASPPMR